MIIGICGGTGSGKTTIARKIIESVGMESVILIEQDSYYRNLEDMPLDERHQANFDHPDAIDSDLLMNHIKRLKGGQTVEMPVYDFASHTRKPETEHLRTETCCACRRNFDLCRKANFGFARCARFCGHTGRHSFHQKTSARHYRTRQNGRIRHRTILRNRSPDAL